MRKCVSWQVHKILKLFCRQDLVGEALIRLGYSSDLIPSARGSIVIRNWKPLPMEKVADGPLLTVGDILAELTSVATLKIQVYRSRPPPPSPAAEVRNKLLRLLLLHSHTLLVSAGCPLDEVRVKFFKCIDSKKRACKVFRPTLNLLNKTQTRQIYAEIKIYKENVRLVKKKYVYIRCKSALIWRTRLNNGIYTQRI